MCRKHVVASLHLKEESQAIYSPRREEISIYLTSIFFFVLKGL